MAWAGSQALIQKTNSCDCALQLKFIICKFPPPPATTEPSPYLRFLSLSPMLQCQRLKGGVAEGPSAVPLPRLGPVLPKAAGEPGGGVRRVRSSPGHCLPGEARGPRGRAQVSTDNAEQSPQCRCVHADPHSLRASGRGDWRPNPLVPLMHVSNPRPFRARYRGPGR